MVGGAVHQGDAADEAHGVWNVSKVPGLHLKSASQLIRGVRRTAFRQLTFEAPMSSAKSRQPTRNTDGEGSLFPSQWPCWAWRSFSDALLAVVYERAPALWPKLCEACTALTNTVEHQVYEGVIDGERPFREALPHIWMWRDSEPVLQEARSLLGRAEWKSTADRWAERRAAAPQASKD